MQVEKIKNRLNRLQTEGKDTIGGLLRLELVECDPQKQEYLLRGKTEPWMRNLTGTLHGGICATLVDQAMGLVAYCSMPSEGIAPTIQMQVEYHRPLIPGEDVLILVRMVSVTRNLFRLSAEATLASAPDKVCLTSSATYFYKPFQA